MKTLLITSYFLLCFITSSGAQTQLVILAGASPSSNPTTAGLIVRGLIPQNEFAFNMTNVSPKYSAGLKLHLPVSNPFFHEIGVTYTRRTFLYTMAYTYADLHEEPYKEMEESEEMLQVPATVGVRMGAIDVTSGLTGIISLSKDSELDHMDGFNSNTSKFRMGWNAGFRVHLLQAAVGVEYQGELSRIGQGMSVHGQSLEMRNVPGQVVFSLQYAF